MAQVRLKPAKRIGLCLAYTMGNVCGKAQSPLSLVPCRDYILALGQSKEGVKVLARYDCRGERRGCFPLGCDCCIAVKRLDMTMRLLLAPRAAPVASVKNAHYHNRIASCSYDASMKILNLDDR